jgi:hypothetical protein
MVFFYFEYRAVFEVNKLILVVVLRYLLPDQLPKYFCVFSILCNTENAKKLNTNLKKKKIRGLLDLFNPR